MDIEQIMKDMEIFLQDDLLSREMFAASVNRVVKECGFTKCLGDGTLPTGELKIFSDRKTALGVLFALGIIAQHGPMPAYLTKEHSTVYGNILMMIHRLHKENA